MNRAAEVLLERLELAVDPRTPVNKLRVGAQQVVEIAKALSTDARIIIMDEPTSAISESEIAALFRVIAELKRTGVGIIYITHKLDELPQIADDVTILRDGEFIHAAPFESLTSAEMIRLMVGRDLTELFPKSETQPGVEVLRVEGLSLADHAAAWPFSCARCFLRSKTRRGARFLWTNGCWPYRIVASPIWTASPVRLQAPC